MFRIFGIMEKQSTWPSRTALAAGVAAGLIAAAAAVVVGPQPIRTADDQPTGSPAVSDVLSQSAPAAAHHLSAFTISDDNVTFGGLGADENDEFEIGSITKTFTAELLQNAIDDGDLTLDTTVGEVIDVGDSPVGTVTLEELANHTSGLPRLGNSSIPRKLGTLFLGSNPYADTTRQDVIDAAAAADLKDRGERHYSNLGFALLGQVIAESQGTSYEQLLNDEILQPLGMSHTYLAVPGSTDSESPRGLLANGRESQPWEMDGDAPAGAIRSTAADMSLYAQHLLDTGIPDFTWVTDRPEGVAWHNGGTGGFKSMLVLDPEAGTAAYVVNDSTAKVDKLGLTLLEETNR